MRTLTMAASALLFTVVAACAESPPVPHPLVGSWERFSLIAPGGMTEPDAPPSRLIFSADGFYSVTSMLRDRPKVAKPVAELSKEELVARFESVVARSGRYVIGRDTVTRHIDAHSDPNQRQGAPEAFVIVGDTLTLSEASGRVASYVRAR